MSYKMVGYYIFLITLKVTVFAYNFQENRERIERKYANDVRKFDEDWQNSLKEHDNFHRKFNREWSSRFEGHMAGENRQSLILQIFGVLALILLLLAICCWCNFCKMKTGHERDQTSNDPMPTADSFEAAQIEHQRRITLNEHRRLEQLRLEQSSATPFIAPTNQTQQPTSSKASEFSQSKYPVPPSTSTNHPTTGTGRLSSNYSSPRRFDYDEYTRPQEPTNPNFVQSSTYNYDDPPPPYPGNL